MLVVDDHPADAARLLAALRRHPQSVEHEVLLVANALAGELTAGPGADLSVLRIGERLGWADSRNLGLRRSRGA